MQVNVSRRAPSWLTPHRLDDHFVYEYTLIVDNVAADAVSNFLRQVRSNVVPAFCTGDLRFFRELNVAVVYRYKYPNGVRIGEVSIADADCD